MRNIGDDYFDELLERIRDIRASEKRFYKKITDIYALSIDYDGKSEEAKKFFATVQNKLHFAIHGHTAAELIEQRADASKDNMGLTTWKGDKVRKGDITVAILRISSVFSYLGISCLFSVKFSTRKVIGMGFNPEIHLYGS